MGSPALMEKKPGSGRPSIDCRVYERKTCGVPTTCQPATARDDNELRWSATIIDISQGGVRLQLQRRFERGTPLAVELPGDEQNESSVVFVKVVHLHAQSDGTWALGCKFISDLSEDEVHRLLTAEQYVLHSQRKRARSESKDSLEDMDSQDSGQILWLTNVRIAVEIKKGMVRRFHIQRLDVEKSWPLTAGKTLRLRGRSRDKSPWSFEIEVTQLKQENERWTLHGRLTSATDNLLHAWKQGASRR
jgi:hypothetical protein